MIDISHLQTAFAQRGLTEELLVCMVDHGVRIDAPLIAHLEALVRAGDWPRAQLICGLLSHLVGDDSPSGAAEVRELEAWLAIKGRALPPAPRNALP